MLRLAFANWIPHGRFCIFSDLAAIEGQSLSNGGVDLSLEIDLFNACIDFIHFLIDLRIDADGLSEPHAKWVRSLAQAHRIALAGADDAIKSAFLCARLQRAADDWAVWKQRWFAIPEARRPRNDYRQAGSGLPPTAPDQRPFDFGIPDQSHGRPGIKVTLRNALHLASEPGQEERFYSGAPSQTFRALSRALRDKPHVNRVAGRRTFVLVASRGLGKGYFFSTLQDTAAKRRLWWLLHELGGGAHAVPPGMPDRKSWSCAAFFNLSFSSEVASVFDRISEFLHDELKDRLENSDKATWEQLSTHWQELSSDRIGRLEFAAEQLADAAILGRRLLIVINSVNVLFDAEGYPKNEQVRRVFDALLGETAKLAPIDLVLISTDTALPRYFRTEHSKTHSDQQTGTTAVSDRLTGSPGTGFPGEAANANGTYPTRNAKSRTAEFASDPRPMPLMAVPVTVLYEPDGDMRQVRTVNQQIDELALRKAEDPNEGPITDGAFVHFLQPANAIVVVGAFFPALAVIEAHAMLAKEPGDWLPAEASSGAPPSVLTPVGASAWTEKLIGMVSETIPHGSTVRWRTLFPALMIVAALRVADGKPDMGALLEDVRTALANASSEGDVDVATALGVLLNLAQRPGKQIGMDAFRKLAVRFYDRLQDRYQGAGGGRFVFTVLLAAASEHLIPTPGASWNARTWHAAAERVTAFLDRELLIVEGLGRRRDDILIGRVLDHYKQRHIARDPLPIMSDYVQAGTSLFRLQDMVLWHLAVIGEPVEPEVLVYCPQIRDSLDAVVRQVNDWKQSPGEQGGTTREAGSKAPTRDVLLQQTLSLLLNRCLIYRLHPGWVSNTGHDQSLERYGVHRLLQRHLFRQIGAPFVEYSEPDQFMITLYASQPNDLPRLPYAVHLQIRRMVAALSGYPDVPSVSSWYAEEMNAETQGAVRGAPVCRRLLRAALGVMRTIYSVAVLARLDLPTESAARGSRDMPERDFGLFEDNRRQVRWLLLQAVQLKGDDAPFYQEEVVWLFNESAVLSLAQGRLSDAVVLFDRALEVARGIEPNGVGALHTRILLNLAATNIDRGRGRAARGDLERIAARASVEHGVVGLIARGYLGLIAHLAGDYGRAQADYEAL